MMLIWSRKCLSSLLVAACLHGSHAYAVEGGNDAYLKGYRDVLTGIVPQAPGAYFRDDLYFYSGSVGKTVLEGQVDVNVDLDVMANLIRPTFVTPWTLLGGRYAFGLSWSQSDVDIHASAVTPFGHFNTRDGRVGIGDLVISPFILGWSSGRWYANTTLSIWAPVGSYSSDHLANSGKNYWSIAPQVGVTYFDPAAGWDLSIAIVYLVNFENPATHYTSGNVVHVDAYAGRQVTPWLKLGVAGYAMQQVTDDSGSGALLGGFRARVFGIGPSASLTYGLWNTPVTLLLKYYREFGAENAFQGDAATASFSFRF